MYLDVVRELRSLIKEEGIKTGEKLPSERELVERMQVGRSTVREALRSLELLGLIETRRGEGTFLADFGKHQLVEVLAEFIMQQPNSVMDVLETRKIHERAAIQTVCQCTDLRILPVWKSLHHKILDEGGVLREDIIRETIVASGNRLSLKIWFLLKQYSQVPFHEKTVEAENEVIIELLHGISIGDEKSALTAYTTWIQDVEGKKGGCENDSRYV